MNGYAHRKDDQHGHRGRLRLSEHECGSVLQGSTEAWGSLSALGEQIDPFIMSVIGAGIHRLVGFQDIGSGNVIQYWR